MEYGLIGEHLSHSYSKEIHERLYGGPYELKELEPQELGDFMVRKDFKAINVTIPYKQDVIPYLDEISPKAKSIGAVNTIVNKNGRLYGYNTDFEGLKSLIERIGCDFSGKKVLIAGTGGTSKTATAVAWALGAEQVYKLTRRKIEPDDRESQNGQLPDRSVKLQNEQLPGRSVKTQNEQLPGRSVKLQNEQLPDRSVKTQNEQLPDKPDTQIITYEEALEAHRDADFIINTTPCGMYPKPDAMPLNPADYPKLKGLADVIYNPLATKLVSAAKELGIPAQGGLYMLVVQAVCAAELFLDRKFDDNETESIFREIYGRKSEEH